MLTNINTIWYRLPREIQLKIFADIEFHDAINLVSNDWKQLSANSSRRKLQNEFGIAPALTNELERPDLVYKRYKTMNAYTRAHVNVAYLDLKSNQAFENNFPTIDLRMLLLSGNAGLLNYLMNCQSMSSYFDFRYKLINLLTSETL